MKLHPFAIVGFMCAALFAAGTLVPGPQTISSGGLGQAAPLTVGKLEQLGFWFGGLTATSQGAIIGSLTTMLGGLLAALVALANSWLTHWGSERRLRIQLDSDRVAKKIQREMEVRKDVFLACAEACQAGLATIFRLANIDTPPLVAMGEFEAKRGAMARLHIIGSTSSLRAMMDLMTTLANNLLTLGVMRSRTESIKKVHADLLEQQKRHFGERDRALDAMKGLAMQSVPTTDPRWQFLERLHTVESKHASDLQLDIEEADLNAKGAILDLLERAMQMTLECGPKMPVMFRAVRKELDVDFSDADFREYYEESARTLELQTAHLNGLLGRGRAAQARIRETLNQRQEARRSEQAARAAQ